MKNPLCKTQVLNLSFSISFSIFLLSTCLNQLAQKMHSERIFIETLSNQLPDLSLGIKFNPTTSSLTTELSLAPPSAATTLLGGHGSFTDDQEPPRNLNISSLDVSDGLKILQPVHNCNRCHSPTSPYFSSTVLDTTSTLTNMSNRSFPYLNFSGVTRFSEISSHHHPQSNNYRYGLGSLPHEVQIHGLMRSRSLPKLPRRRCTRAPRMRWTTSLHARFVHAVELRGGLERATPKSVMELMDVKDLTLHHVKSHLQVLKVKKRSRDIKKRDPLSTNLQKKTKI